MANYVKYRYNSLNLFFKAQSDVDGKSNDGSVAKKIVWLHITVFAGRHYFQVGFDAQHLND